MDSAPLLNNQNDYMDEKFSSAGQSLEQAQTEA